MSVDECYMDFTGIANRFVSPVEGAMEIKNKCTGGLDLR